MTATLCEYKFRSGETCGEKCKEEVYGTSPYCILHIDFPDETNSEFAKIKRDKDAKVQEKIDPKNPNKNFNFEGAKITSIDLSRRKDVSTLSFVHATIKGDAWFNNATIKGDALFDNAVIEGDVEFISATIKGDALFDNATIKRNARFYYAVIEGDVRFNSAIIELSAQFSSVMIKGKASFDNATIKGFAYFNGATIKRYAWFNNATIEGDALFDNATIKGKASFDNATIKGYASFDNATLEGKLSGCYTAEITGELSFESIKFTSIKAQEDAYRKAKQVWEKLGNRTRADDYFYREMVAKRKQKNQPIRSLELIVQYPLGYGVRPSWLATTWILVAITVGAFLTGASGSIMNLPFGIAATFVPGYGISSPNAPSGFISLCIICIATIFSAFFWAAFITVFSRKFMR